MKATFSLPGLALLAQITTLANSAALGSRETPTVYLCGDSTMARSGANDGDTDGWGQYISKYLTGVTVVNKAIGGRSARSYYEEGRFQAVASQLNAGDIVVIEFGHNDGGSPESNDNGRSDCYGSGTETCVSDVTGETVYTFVFYVIQAAKQFLDRGATVIFSSQTPNNLWEDHTYASGASRFVGYQKRAAKTLGTGTAFVDHFQAVANMYLKLGDSATNALYPNDHTHTSPKGADLSAQAFAEAIATRMNGTTSLAGHVIDGYPVVY